MRYSRFRLQMDGPSRAPRVAKKKPPKSNGIKSNAQTPFPHIQPGFIPKLEAFDCVAQNSSLIKRENIGQCLSNIQSIPDVSEGFQFSPLMAHPGITYPYVPSYVHHGMPFSMGTGIMSTGYPLLGSDFASWNDSPSSPFVPQQDFSNNDRCISHSVLNNSPTMNWEPQPPLERENHLSESPHVKPEDQTEQTDLHDETLPDISVKREARLHERTSPRA